jgi:hypothetical protein
MIKIKQIIALKNGFIALSEDGCIYHVYQILNLETHITEWTWSRIDIDI